MERVANHERSAPIPNADDFLRTPLQFKPLSRLAKVENLLVDPKNLKN
jgi:hypothetical protein